jgi:uncharacterized protein GlcG (DUF336 family)
MDLLAFAKAIAGRVEAEASRTGVPVAVSVIDVHGNVILMHRMNGAPAFSIELFERKAYTSALVGCERPTFFRSRSLGRRSSR